MLKGKTDVARYQKCLQTSNSAEQTRCEQKILHCYYETRGSMISYANQVEQLTYALQEVELTGGDKEIAMPVLNGLPPGYENLLMALDASGREDRVFTLDYVKSRLLKKE